MRVPDQHNLFKQRVRFVILKLNLWVLYFYLLVTGLPLPAALHRRLRGLLGGWGLLFLVLDGSQHRSSEESVGECLVHGSDYHAVLLI